MWLCAQGSSRQEVGWFICVDLGQGVWVLPTPALRLAPSLLSLESPYIGVTVKFTVSIPGGASVLSGQTIFMGVYVFIEWQGSVGVTVPGGVDWLEGEIVITPFRLLL